jgi:hypothetical protein
MRDVAITIALLAACGPGTRNDSTGGDDTPIPDAPPGPIDSIGDDPGAMNFVYAHTAKDLYKVDPDTLAITLIGAFQWKLPDGTPSDDQMTDLAINKDNLMIGLSFGGVYNVDPMTAVATQLNAALGGTFNGLSFVPAESVGQTGDDVLVGTRNDDGQVFQVDPMTGAVAQIGNMGAQYVSSGDLCSVKGFGTVQTTSGAPDDVLVRLNPPNFAATPIGSGTGFGEIYGVAFWKGKIFGFTLDGKFVTIDPGTGVGTLVQQNGPEWYGAAVRTTAPIFE